MVGRAEVIPPKIELAFDLALSDQMKEGDARDLNGLENLLEPRFLEPAVSGAVNRRVAKIDRKWIAKKEKTAQKNHVHRSGGKLRVLLDAKVQELAAAKPEPATVELAKAEPIYDEFGPWILPDSLFYCGAPLTTGIFGNNAE